MGSPLAGKRVVNTRALHQAGELDRLLEDHGAIPVSFPCIAIRPPADVEPLDSALRDLREGRFDWVVFTSVNTVEAVAGRLGVLALHEQVGPRTREPVKGSPTGTMEDHLPILAHQPEPQPRHPERSEGSPSSGATLSGERVPLRDQGGAGEREPVKGSPTQTVGHGVQTEGGDALGRRAPASERLLADLSPGLQPRATAPDRTAPDPIASTSVAAVGAATGEAVTRLLGWPVDARPDVATAAELGRTLPIAPGDRVLLPKSALAGPALATILSGRGAVVTEVVAYETVTGAGGVDLASWLVAGEVDAICFTSGSTVRGCLERLAGAARPDAVLVGCIGPETARVARAAGLRVDVIPDRPTAGALVEALAACFGRDGGDASLRSG